MKNLLLKALESIFDAFLAMGLSIFFATMAAVVTGGQVASDGAIMLSYIVLCMYFGWERGYNDARR